MRRFSIVLALVVFLLTAPNSGCVESEQRLELSIEQQLDSIVASHIEDNRIGCSVAVITDGQLTYKKNLGLADVGANTPVTDQTAFDLAQASRHFTAANILWLEANGAVRMDDDIRIYIPEMPRTTPTVTVADLVYHTSGVKDYHDVMRTAALDSAADDLDIIDLLAEEDLEFTPGTKYSPNPSNHFLLAFAIQRVPSMTLGQWAQNILFGPLEMDNTAFCDNAEKQPAEKATGYIKAGQKGFVKSPPKNPTIAGDTGLYTTVDDLLKWEKMLTDRKFLNERFHDLLDATGKIANGKRIDYAAGMNIDRKKGMPIFSTSGSAAGFSATIQRFPEKKMTVLCMSNYQYLDTEAIVSEVSEYCLANIKSKTDDFVSIFDGETFEGWEGNLDIFRIEDGAIVGGNLNERIAHNEFLCTKTEYDNFELRLKVKLLGDPASANAGIQIRSRRIPDHHEMIGYQADMGQHYWGCLYDESRRRKVLAQVDRAKLDEVLKPGDWNDYIIRCDGKSIQLWINGYQTVNYTEPDNSIEQTGIIGLQIHGGKASEAWYKDIKIKKL